MSNKIEGFDWDDGNWPKCAKHGVSQEEIEEIFSFPLKEAEDPCTTETRKRAIGITSAGRHIFLVFTYRIKNGTTLIRPISARYMHQKEIDAYGRTSS